MDAATVSAITGWFGIAAPALVLAMFLWVVWRTESLYFVRRRLWQLVHGNEQIEDPEVRAFANEQTSLNSFRLLAGVPVASLEEARLLLQWTRLHGVQMTTVRMCGAYFDAEHRQVRTQKVPSRLWQIARLFWFALSVALCAISAGGMTSNKVLLSLNATQRFLLAAPADMRTAWPPWPMDASPLRPADCQLPLGANAQRTGFTDQEVDLLCGLMKSDGHASTMDAALKGQRWSLLVLFGVSLWLAWLNLMAWGSIHAARGLAARKLDPSVSGSQLAFDWPS